MPSLRGLKLALSVLSVPAVAGFAAFQLTDKYKSLMNFDNVFFLVKATQELYDSGIPKVPEEVEKAVDEILKHKKQVFEKIREQKSKKAKRSLPENLPEQVNSRSEDQEKPEIFNGGKGYWCRYFDYSGGKENIIMQYDPFCTLYNIFEHKSQESIQVNSEPNSEQNNLTVDISQLNAKTTSLESKKLKSNSEFKKGGFYLLRLDKNRIPQVNSSFNIELTVTGDGKRHSEKVYHKKITTLKVQVPLRGSPEDQVNFNYSAMPSSRLIVKKVNGSVVEKVDSKTENSSERSEEASYYFKHNNNNADKLYVEEAWSFGKDSKSSTSNKVSDKFNLSLIDEEPLSEFGAGASEASTPPDSSEEKYYLFRNVSDFWKYRVGDQIDLYKSTSSNTNRRKRNLEQQDDSGEQEKKLATFQIVSGALLHSSISPRCVTKDQKEEGKIKQNLKKKYQLIDKSADKKGFCKSQGGLPEHVLFLIGYNEESNGSY